jgi:hypothetical protein
MNPHETAQLPFFLQFLEPQFAERKDEDAPGGEDQARAQTLKYPSDGDEDLRPYR